MVYLMTWVCRSHTTGACYQNTQFMIESRYTDLVADLLVLLLVSRMKEPEAVLAMASLVVGACSVYQHAPNKLSHAGVVIRKHQTPLAALLLERIEYKTSRWISTELTLSPFTLCGQKQDYESAELAVIWRATGSRCSRRTKPKYFRRFKVDNSPFLAGWLPAQPKNKQTRTLKLENMKQSMKWNNH